MPDDRRVVVDASALIQALGGTAAGGAVLRGRRLLAPALLFPEVANALRRRELQGLLTSLESTSLFSALLAVQLDIVDWRPCAERVWELRHAVTAYDATYVAMAELLDVPLITADRRLARAHGLRCELVLV